MRRSSCRRGAHRLRLHRRPFSRANSAGCPHRSPHRQRVLRRLRLSAFSEKQARSLYPVTLPSVDAEITAKVDLLMRADASARAYDAAHQGSSRQLRRRAPQHSRNRIGRHVRGRLAAAGADERLVHRENAKAIPARGSSGGGGRVALDFFFGEKNA